MKTTYTKNKPDVLHLSVLLLLIQLVSLRGTDSVCLHALTISSWVTGGSVVEQIWFV